MLNQQDQPISERTQQLLDEYNEFCKGLDSSNHKQEREVKRKKTMVDFHQMKDCSF